MKKYRLGIVGCGKLGTIVARAAAEGLLPDYEPVGMVGRTLEKAQTLAALCGGQACETVDELLALHPDYVVETASVAALREIADKVLRAGANLVTVSIGAFADEAFYAQTAQTARENGVHVHIASGAVGGFDVLRTAALMGNVTARMTTEKGPDSLRGTSVFSEKLYEKSTEVFHGTAAEAIELFPTKVNVAVAASLASAGPAHTAFSIKSTPDFVGDDHKIEVENDEVRVTVDVYSKTSAIAGWSVVSALQNIASPIVF